MNLTKQAVTSDKTEMSHSPRQRYIASVEIFKATAFNSDQTQTPKQTNIESSVDNRQPT